MCLLFCLAEYMKKQRTETPNPNARDLNEDAGGKGEQLKTLADCSNNCFRSVFYSFSLPRSIVVIRGDAEAAKLVDFDGGLGHQLHGDTAAIPVAQKGGWRRAVDQRARRRHGRRRHRDVSTGKESRRMAE